MLNLQAHVQGLSCGSGWLLASVYVYLLRLCGGGSSALMARGQNTGTGPELGCWDQHSAANRSIGYTTGCTITEKAPTRAFSWLKAATTAFTFKTLC